MEEKEFTGSIKKEEDLKAYFRQLKSVAVVFRRCGFHLSSENSS